MGACRGTDAGACGLVAGWAGQLGVLVPWDVTAVAASRLYRHLPSNSDLGFKRTDTLPCCTLVLLRLIVEVSVVSGHLTSYVHPSIFNMVSTDC